MKPIHTSKVDRRSKAYKLGFRHGKALVENTMYMINEDNIHWAIPDKHKKDADILVQNYKNKSFTSPKK